MNWSPELKRMVAWQKREERAVLKRQRLLDQKLKEMAKLSALEQASLEVEAFENSLEVLLSVHKEASKNFDWFTTLAGLPPFPLSTSDHSQVAQDASELKEMREVAKRVLAGESEAYGQALQELSPFSELSALGSALGFIVHTPTLIECDLSVNGRSAIPEQVKSLTSTGKLSTKAMPKARRHEIYQDYVCGCVLRVAREVLALLPVSTVIVTAHVQVDHSKSRQNQSIPVLSVVLPRKETEELDFTDIDPSDTIELFLHRGDVKVSRKSGEFAAIIPFRSEDVIPPVESAKSLDELLDELRNLRSQLTGKLNAVLVSSQSITEPVLN